MELSSNILSAICAIISDAAYPQVSHWETLIRLLFDKGAAAAKGRVQSKAIKAGPAETSLRAARRCFEECEQWLDFMTTPPVLQW